MKYDDILLSPAVLPPTPSRSFAILNLSSRALIFSPATRIQGRETYIYNYDDLGRVTDVILPTGEKVKLTSDLSTDEGLTVKVAAPLQALKRGDKQRFMEFKMRNERFKMLTITDGKCLRAILCFLYI